MRSAAISALVLVVAACGGGAGSSAPAPSRFESVEATDGDVDQVLRDVCDVLAQGKIHVLSLHSQVAKERLNITLTVQTGDTAKLSAMLAKVSQINGILRARRK